MNKIRIWIVLGFATVLLSSCTVAHYEINNWLNRVAPHDNEGTCDIKYALMITSGSHTNTFGVNQDNDERQLKLKRIYGESIENVLKEKKCTAVQVRDEDAANYIIHVERLISLSALPQEWLTGLSFGLIPSWGTRPRQFVYTFEDRTSKKKHSYVVDQKSYNHLVLFPVFWISFVTLDEFNIFEKTLMNFMES